MLSFLKSCKGGGDRAVSGCVSTSVLYRVNYMKTDVDQFFQSAVLKWCMKPVNFKYTYIYMLFYLEDLYKQFQKKNNTVNRKLFGLCLFVSKIISSVKISLIYFWILYNKPIKLRQNK